MAKETPCSQMSQVLIHLGKSTMHTGMQENKKDSEEN